MLLALVQKGFYVNVWDKIISLQYRVIIVLV
jgi:hypothetical protein